MPIRSLAECVRVARSLSSLPASHRGCYSINSSASVSIDGDTAIPSVALDLVEFEFGRLLDLGTSGGGKPLISWFMQRGS
jgi:hypothetical protein